MDWRPPVPFGPGVVCGLCLLLVLPLLGGFSFHTKTNTSKFQFDPGISRATGLSVVRLLSAVFVK